MLSNIYSEPYERSVLTLLVHSVKVSPHGVAHCDVRIGISKISNQNITLDTCVVERRQQIFYCCGCERHSKIYLILSLGNTAIETRSRCISNANHEEVVLEKIKNNYHINDDVVSVASFFLDNYLIRSYECSI